MPCRTVYLTFSFSGSRFFTCDRSTVQAYCTLTAVSITSFSSSMEKLVVTENEVLEVELRAEPSSPSPAKVPRPIPIWARLALLPTVLALPVLCLITIVLRIALRATAPRTREAWNAYLNTLLVTSALLNTAAAIFMFSAFPVPPQSISAGSSDLDERASFPALPAHVEMKGSELASQLKPLVMIATPVARRWFGRGDEASGLTGAALLLTANEDGYLFATARHVADGTKWRTAKGAARVLLTSGLGGWVAADVIARHRDADVALLWVARRSGSGRFVQPLSPSTDPGTPIYVIGHPEGLNFSISSGIVSRLSGDIVQISAPVSPGNSGGPVYDVSGRLLAIVSSKIDRNVDPNAENLSFAVRGDVFLHSDTWDYLGDGKRRLEWFVQQSSTTPAKSE